MPTGMDFGLMVVNQWRAKNDDGMEFHVSCMRVELGQNYSLFILSMYHLSKSLLN